MAKEKIKEEEISFEQAIYKLDEPVRQMESGKLSLEESIRLFEEGVRLTDYCNELLNRAEKKVSILLRTEDGTVAAEAFEPEKGAGHG
jgi:exodeoxyribonuclease VII small subunit